MSNQFMKLKLFPVFGVGSKFRFLYRIVKPKFRAVLYKNEIVKKEVIFIHIPKAAGRSISKSVFGIENVGHYTVQDFFSADSVCFEKYFVFSFVRNPLDRLASAYHYLTNYQGTDADNYVGQLLNRETADFNDFVLNWLDRKRIYSWFHFVPQFEFLTINGEMNVDYLGRFETLNSDYQELLAKLGGADSLKIINKGVVKEVGYDKEVMDKVHSLYKEDYVLLGY